MNKEFTGRHMLFVMLAFFGIIIAVNMTMATFAAGSWSGFVVRNSYIASQEFNEKAQAARRQAALGWRPQLTLGEGRLTFSLAGAEGEAITLHGAKASLYRPVSAADDIALELAPAGAGSTEATVDLEDGVWIIEVSAITQAGQTFRHTSRIFVRSGALR